MARGTRGHIKHEGTEEALDLVDARTIRSRRGTSTPRSVQKITMNNNTQIRKMNEQDYDDDLVYRKQKANKGKKPKSKKKK